MNKLIIPILTLLICTSCIKGTINEYKYRTITYEITKGNKKDTISLTLYTDGNVEVVQDNNGYMLNAYKTHLYFKDPIRLIKVSGNGKK